MTSRAPAQAPLLHCDGRRVSSARPPARLRCGVRRIPLLIALLLPLACSSDAKKADDAEADDEKAPAEPQKTPTPSAEAPDDAAPAEDPALKDAYENLCNAAERSGATEDMDPSERAVKIANWIKAEVESKEVLDLMGTLATMSPESRGPALRDAAKKAGVDPCPLADES